MKILGSFGAEEQARDTIYNTYYHEVVLGNLLANTFNWTHFKSNFHRPFLKISMGMISCILVKDLIILKI